MGTSEDDEIEVAMKYRKIDPRIWNDANFCRLSKDAKFAFLFLLTHQHMSMVGAMRGTVSGLAAELDVSVDAFGELFELGLAQNDVASHFIGLPNFIKYNQPESPNVVRAWGAAFDLLPECELKAQWFQRLKAFAERLGKGFHEAFLEAFAEALPEALREVSRRPSPNQEQEQEHITERKRTSVKTTDAAGSVVDWFAAEFWPAYPRKTAKAAALKAMQRRKPDEETRQRMIAAVKRQSQSPQWTKDGGQFIPHAATWINQSRWDDEPIAVPAASWASTSVAAAESVEERIRRQDADASFVYTYRCQACGAVHGRSKHDDPKICTAAVGA